MERGWGRPGAGPTPRRVDEMVAGERMSRSLG